jgi:purine-binding chemotaxis protein CheW
VTAVSLMRRLAKAPLDSLRGAVAIGIEHDGESFALVVDDVGDVIPCEEAAEIAHPPHIDPRRAQLTKRYYRVDSGILPILDMDAVFNLAEPNRSRGSAIHKDSGYQE